VEAVAHPSLAKVAEAALLALAWQQVHLAQVVADQGTPLALVDQEPTA
jgi:hypothetical protein